MTDWDGRDCVVCYQPVTPDQWYVEVHQCYRQDSNNMLVYQVGPGFPQSKLAHLQCPKTEED